MWRKLKLRELAGRLVKWGLGRANLESNRGRHKNQQGHRPNGDSPVPGVFMDQGGQGDWPRLSRRPVEAEVREVPSSDRMGP